MSTLISSVGKTLLVSIIFPESLNKSSELVEVEICVAADGVIFDATFLGTKKGWLLFGLTWVLIAALNVLELPTFWITF